MGNLVWIARVLLIVGAAAAHLLSAASALSQDWPQWRGPNRDGVVHGVKVPGKWPKALKEEWTVTVGEGVSSPVVVGDAVYVFTRQKKAKDPKSSAETGEEVVSCFDVAKGKERWRSEPYLASYKPHVDANFPWPRSTPAVADGKVFTLGMGGMLSCLEAQTGKLLWRKDFKSGTYGGSNSPLVVDGLCIIHVGDRTTGGLTAFDAQTGKVVWCYADGTTSACGSPILGNLAGERQVVTLSHWNFFGVSPATGKKWWELRGPFQANTLCNTPLQYKDMLIFADCGEPLRAIRVTKGDKGITLQDVWKARGLPLYYSSPVLVGDLIFGMSTRKQGTFFCLDAPSGKTLWECEGRQGANASIVNAGSVLLFLKERGRLLVVKPSAASFERIAEYQVSETDTHAHPVFLENRILIKDGTMLRSFLIETHDSKD